MAIQESFSNVFEMLFNVSVHEPGHKMLVILLESIGLGVTLLFYGAQVLVAVAGLVGDQAAALS